MPLIPVSALPASVDSEEEDDPFWAKILDVFRMALESMELGRLREVELKEKRSRRHARSRKDPPCSSSRKCSATSRACCHSLSVEEKQIVRLGHSNILQPRSHSMKDLAWLLEVMAPNEWPHHNTDLQTRAISAFKELYSTLPDTVRRMKRKGKGGEMTETLTRNFFPILDDLFFFGALQQCGLKLRFKDDFDRNRSFGFFRPTTHEIVIFRVRETPPWHDSYFRWYLGTLVYEMIHAFFDIHQCYSSKCSKENRHLNGIDNGEVSQGHGSAFQRVEKALDLAAQSVLPADIWILDAENFKVVPEWPKTEKTDRRILKLRAAMRGKVGACRGFFD